MRTQLLLLFLACTLLAGRASAQVTVTAADLEALLRTRTTYVSYGTYETTGLQAVADLKGGDAVYDLSGLSFTLEDDYSWEVITCAATVPGCSRSELAAANLIVRSRDAGAPADSAGFIFYQLDSDELTLLGISVQGDLDDTTPGVETQVFTYVPGWTQMKLPLQMGTSWTSTSTSSGEFDGQPFSSTLTEEAVVEGWGLLKTPEGEAQALKVRSTTTLTFGEFSTTAVNIQFVTRGGLSASLYLGETGEVVSASYGVWTHSGGNVGTDPDADVPTVMTLEAAYPSPFNPQTTIPFTLAQAGQVTLRVYTALGQEVALLVDGMRSAGRHEVRFDAAELPGGLYFYTLEAAGERQTRSVVLVK